MTDISILIPAFNEAASIAAVVKAVQGLFSGGENYEILVINDGSTDGTAVAASQAGATVITNPHNVGYGFSLKRGIRAAQYECLVIVDADGTYPIAKIPELVAAYRSGFDMVVGARQGPEYYSSFTKRLARYVFKWMAEFTVGKKIPDINSGFRVINRAKVLLCLDDLSNAFSFTTSVTLVFFMKHFFVNYIPVSYEARVGATKVRYVRDALRTLQIMVEIIVMYNPIKFFLMMAFFPLLLTTFGIIWAIVTADVYFIFWAVTPLYWTLLFLALGGWASMFRKR